MKTLIAISTYNRLFVTRICLEQLNKTKKDCDIKIYDDMSLYDPSELAEYADSIFRFTNKMGINASRKYQFKDFLKTDYDFLYLTDPDAFHDPDWYDKIMELYEMYNIPVSLYNTIHHLHKTIYQDSKVMIRHYAAGISILLHRDHVKIINDEMNSMNGTDWDFDIGNILGNKFCVSLTSYVDHYGAFGIHNNSWDRDKAVNPTPFLRYKRQELIPIIENNIADMMDDVNKSTSGMFGINIVKQ